MPWRQSEINTKQASIAFCLYAVSFLAFLIFWINTMTGAIAAGSLLFAAISLWLLTGVLAVRTQFFLIDRSAWKNVAAFHWEERNRDRLVTVFILWNIANIVVLALDATLRKTDVSFAVYPWFMLASISCGYVALMRRCAGLAFPMPAPKPEPEE